MRSTAIERRTLLRLLGAGLASALPLGAARGDAPERLYLGARTDAGGRHRASGFDASGRPAFDLPLPARGHAFAVAPGGRVAVHFARRPGTFALAIDLARGRVLHTFESPPERHFQGHGVFARDGRLLYASENDFEAGRGVIGVYDAERGYRRLGELPAHGIGPHDLRLLPDGRTLVVANGGILTRPELPRVKLNVPTMAPSLAYVDRHDGRLIEAARLPAELHQLGIRHLAVGRDGRVAMAMQYEGPARDRVALVATHRQGETPRLLEAPAEVLRAMRQYCGSAVFDRNARVLAVSAPRGGLVTFWDPTRGRLLATAAVPDASGIAPGKRPGTFLASSGRGGVLAIDARTGKSNRIRSDFLERGRWDNHLAASG